MSVHGVSNATFEPFASIPRLKRGCVVTEKIDGTCSQVYVSEGGVVLAGSRERWVSPGDDNNGFARWVSDHESELVRLGPGRHNGEWWGRGIGRGYGLAERRFSLFNVARWGVDRDRDRYRNDPPACCHVVPVLRVCEFTIGNVDAELGLLQLEGSRAAPGFMNPEGVVVFHVASAHLYKVTLGRDGHKSERKP
jgi:hypothetical protein